LKKVCYKVSLCENCQRQSCTAFIGLSIRAKMIGGERLLKHKFSERGSSADQHFHEIWRILYLHHNYYNGIWNY